MAQNRNRRKKWKHALYVESAANHADKFARALLVMEEAIQEFRLGHEHAPNLPYTRAMGDTYGWCDFCCDKVNWGPGTAELALAKVEEILK